MPVGCFVFLLWCNFKLVLLSLIMYSHKENGKKDGKRSQELRQLMYVSEWFVSIWLCETDHARRRGLVTFAKEHQAVAIWRAKSTQTGLTLSVALYLLVPSVNLGPFGRNWETQKSFYCHTHCSEIWVSKEDLNLRIPDWATGGSEMVYKSEALNEMCILLCILWIRHEQSMAIQLLLDDITSGCAA